MKLLAAVAVYLLFAFLIGLGMVLAVAKGSFWVLIVGMGLFLLAFIEGSSRLLGWYDFAIKRDRHVVWNMAWSQKQDVYDVRQARENGKSKESFSVQTRTQ